MECKEESKWKEGNKKYVLQWTKYLYHSGSPSGVTRPFRIRFYRHSVCVCVLHTNWYKTYFVECSHNTLENCDRLNWSTIRIEYENSKYQNLNRKKIFIVFFLFIQTMSHLLFHTKYGIFVDYYLIFHAKKIMLHAEWANQISHIL